MGSVNQRHSECSLTLFTSNIRTTKSAWLVAALKVTVMPANVWLSSTGQYWLHFTWTTRLSSHTSNYLTSSLEFLTMSMSSPYNTISHPPISNLAQPWHIRHHKRCLALLYPELSTTIKQFLQDSLTFIFSVRLVSMTMDNTL